MIALETCPKCGTKLSNLQTSGRLICPSCKWVEPKSTNKTQSNSVLKNKTEFSKDKIEEEIKKEEVSNQNPKDNYDTNFFKIFFRDESTQKTGKILSIIGFIIMLIGLRYDTTTCDNDFGIRTSCTHNIGLLNNRSNLVNFGGFIFLSGCILFSKPQD